MNFVFWFGGKYSISIRYNLIERLLNMHIFVLHYTSNEQFQLCYIYTWIINERLVYSVLSTEASAFTAYLKTFPKNHKHIIFFKHLFPIMYWYLSEWFFKLNCIYDCPKRGAVLKKYKANCILFWLAGVKNFAHYFEIIETDCLIRVILAKEIT